MNILARQGNSAASTVTYRHGQPGMKNDNPILRIANLSKHYGEFEALNDVSLDIGKGEFVTLLGPSGSGKTTLLNIISGALFPSSGALFLEGRDITHLPARMRGIGMVFQNFALMPHLSVFENIAFPLRIRKVPNSEVKDRVSEALELIKLPGIENRKPKQLSGGQQQRIAIARALVYRPPLILMDEPLGALDRKLRQQMQFEIKRIHDDLGLSMIYVTHDQEEALTMSDRICLMGGGKIRDIGAPGRIYANPSSVFSADFFGATNIFSGSATNRDNSKGVHHETFGLVRTGPTTVPDGQKVGWMVRPERLRFLAAGEVEDNCLEGSISEVILSGQVTQFLVDVGGGHMFNVACLTSDRIGALTVGEQVRIGWPRHATSLLEPE